MIYAHFFVAKTIYALFCNQKNLHTVYAFFFREKDLRTSSGKFLRVESCHPESSDFLGLWGGVESGNEYEDVDGTERERHALRH